MYLRNETSWNSSRRSSVIAIIQNQNSDEIDDSDNSRQNCYVFQVPKSYQRKFKTHDNINEQFINIKVILRRSSCWLKYWSSLSSRALHTIWKYVPKLSGREMTHDDYLTEIMSKLFTFYVKELFTMKCVEYVFQRCNDKKDVLTW